jgi:phosphatidylglycerophosphatase A
MKRLFVLLSTWFYLGKIPFMPGTMGSLGALIIWLLLPTNVLLQISLIIITFVIGLITSKAMIQELGNSDPSEVVIDEVVGMWIALLFIPQEIVLVISAFVLFRIFDIFKPSIIHDSQSLSREWGIMLDDVLAGIFTWFIVFGLTTVC